MSALLSRRTPDICLLTVRFPSVVEVRAVAAVLSSLSGLPSRSGVVFETLATADGVTHLVRGPRSTADAFTRSSRVLLPGIRIEPTSAPTPTMWRLAVRVSWSRQHVLLRTDEVEAAAAGLLAAATPLRDGERLLLRVHARPAHAPSHLPNGRASTRSPWWWPSTGDIADSALTGLRVKYQGPLVRVRVEIAVDAGHPARAKQLLERVLAAVRARRGAHGSPVVRRLSSGALARSLDRPSRGGVLVSPLEVVGLLGWPVGAPRLPGVELGSAPLLLPDRRIPATGRVVGRSNWPGAETRSLAQPVEGATSHTLIVGPTGSGKSALLTRLAAADIEAGRGVLVIDGKGDLVTDLLGQIPASRVEDVIVVDPAAGGRVPGLRVFGQAADPELAADVMLGVLRDLFRDSWGIRSDQWFRAGLVTLANSPDATIGDFPYLFTDPIFRQRVVARVSDPLLLATWAAYEAMSPKEQTHQVGAPVTKISELLGRRSLRTILSQPSPSLDLTRAIAQKKIVLVSLAPGRLGTPAARLLGALLIHSLFTAVQARQAVPPARRSPFLAYIDEPKVLGDIPVPLDGMLELARGMGVGLTISTQSLTQLAAPVRNAALTNAASLIAFRQTADDADLLARHLSSVDADALQHLGAYEVVARLGLGNGTIASPATATTLPPPKPVSAAARVRAWSAELHGADPAEVDRMLAKRHHHPDQSASEGPVGRRRRTS